MQLQAITKKRLGISGENKNIMAPFILISILSILIANIPFSF